jgi:hypothetical protein
MSDNKVVVNGSLIPSVKNVPLDFRCRVAAIEDILNIELPFVGMVVYVEQEEKFYVVKTLKGSKVGNIELECINYITERINGEPIKIECLIFEVEAYGFSYDEIGVIIDNIEPFIKEAEMDENGRLYNVLFGSSYTIGKGEKFEQLVLDEVPKAIFYEVEKVADIANDGRQGGFGSTGVK